MNLKRLIVSFVFFTVFLCSAQDSFKYEERPFYLGFGAGIDFGGVGIKAEYMFLDYAGLFVGGGMPMRIRNLMVNGGVMVKPLPRKLITPYFSGMYGLNSFVLWGKSKTVDLHYNFSLGAGFEVRTRNLNKWQFGIILPNRDSEFTEYIESLKNNPNVNLTGRLYPVLLSTGFKIIL